MTMKGHRNVVNEAALPVRHPAEGAIKPNQMRWRPPLKLRHGPVLRLLEERREG